MVDSVKKIKVQPKRLPLVGDATLWESHLAGSGFDDLPDDLKFGTVKNMYNSGEWEIYWPHVNRTSFVFPDEIILFKEPKKEDTECAYIVNAI